MRRSVYISGPMSGMLNDNYGAFIQRAIELEDAGYKPVIPHNCSPYHPVAAPCSGRKITDKTHGYGCYLLGDLIYLARCEAINFLEGWDASPGARAERAFAEACGIPELVVADGEWQVWGISGA